MRETTEKLNFVSFDGRPLSPSQADLIAAPWGWQIELYDLPAASCPLLRQVGEITLVTQDDDSWEGTAIADFITEDGAFVLLDGIGHLRLIAPADAA
jgi:hypothetical protein